jgi:hypothetical protein
MRLTRDSHFAIWTQMTAKMIPTLTGPLATCLLVIAPILANAQAASPDSAAAERIVVAANTFLATLTKEQRSRVTYAFDDDAQRRRWSNFPVPVVPRAGISLREMKPEQRSAAMNLLSTTLSARGFEKVQQIMQADEVNKENEERNPTGPRRMGPPPVRPAQSGQGGTPAGRGPRAAPSDLFGKDLYYLSFLGKPSIKDPWMLQFGGHHLALNITLAGARGVLTPTLTGAQPATYVENGKTIRPLAQESDGAIALLSSLDAQQRKQAILEYRVSDLVLGPRQDGKTITPEGLQASAMNEKQRAMLLDLISQWTGILNDAAAAARMNEMKEDLGRTWFAWSGPTTVAPGSNIAAYYRIQGPRVVIEYAPQGGGEEAALHVHTMYRDPTNDYGRKLVAQ